MIENSKDYFCIFGGGGIRGIAYVGAIKAINELGITIKGCAGSSVGSIFAALTGLNYSVEELEESFMNFSPEIFRDINFDFIKGFAFSKGELFLAWMRNLIEKKFYGAKYSTEGNEPVRFKDVDKDIVILSVNLTDSSYKEFSREKTPDFEIAKAVRASVSMPGLFKPVEIENEIFVDGDLMKSWPLWRLSENLCPSCCRILEFRLEDIEKDKKIENSISYVNAVYDTVTNFASDFVMDLYGEKDKFDYIKFNLKELSVVNFMISKDRKAELINYGYQTTMNYFKDFLPQKRVKLSSDYKKIYENLIKIKAPLEELNYKEADFCLGNLFISLCENSYNIDKEIYNQILDFKDLFKKNISYHKIFFLNMTTLFNKKLISAKLNEILQIFEDKVLELENSVN